MLIGFGRTKDFWVYFKFETAEKPWQGELLVLNGFIWLGDQQDKSSKREMDCLLRQEQYV